ncbi:hypothetical protein Dimus_009350 [Dionaea muscipula]
MPSLRFLTDQPSSRMISWVIPRFSSLGHVADSRLSFDDVPPMVGSRSWASVPDRGSAGGSRTLCARSWFRSPVMRSIWLEPHLVHEFVPIPCVFVVVFAGSCRSFMALVNRRSDVGLQCLLSLSSWLLVVRRRHLFSAIRGLSEGS